MSSRSFPHPYSPDSVRWETGFSPLGTETPAELSHVPWLSLMRRQKSLRVGTGREGEGLGAGSHHFPSRRSLSHSHFLSVEPVFRMDWAPAAAAPVSEVNEVSV